MKQMKTKTLIAELQEADPSGEMHVTVGNTDIHFLGRQPSYYDGDVQRLIRDDDRSDYNIIGAEFPLEDHIKIHTLPISWALLDFPELPVECHGNEELEKVVEEWREEMRQINERR